MENVMLTTINFDKVCRVCLMESDSMFSIYSELFEDNSEEKIPCIYEILINISSIKIQPDDGLPTMICTKCIDKAHSSYKFQQQCNRSQILLEAYIETISKELARVEEASNISDAPIQKFSLKSETVDANETELPPELVLINENDLIKNEVVENDCDSLNSRIPLSEDTVDQLIKDNLQVDNLELISPQIGLFHLDLKNDEVKESSEGSNKSKSVRELPNMNYYRKEKNDDTVAGVTFPSSTRLKRHSITHTTLKPFKCHICDKCFNRNSSLRVHAKTHLGVRSHVCSVCNKGFLWAHSLRGHMLTHSKDSTEKKCKQRRKTTPASNSTP
ncbi:hypothetical protein NQ315_016830 [Exocentrus adspersus]|uniref:Uncharacterized protein n=1 Tax=Exocentrus adspersus TaxID=1586481 RepID=A0AAV8VX85_9CUCU|nr:hypothetical protein NQ315_016830 [Exocentrus adspersus]